MNVYYVGDRKVPRTSHMPTTLRHKHHTLKLDKGLYAHHSRSHSRRRSQSRLRHRQSPSKSRPRCLGGDSGDTRSCSVSPSRSRCTRIELESWGPVTLADLEEDSDEDNETDSTRKSTRREYSHVPSSSCEGEYAIGQHSNEEKGETSVVGGVSNSKITQTDSFGSHCERLPVSVKTPNDSFSNDFPKRSESFFAGDTKSPMSTNGLPQSRRTLIGRPSLIGTLDTIISKSGYRKDDYRRRSRSNSMPPPRLNDRSSIGGHTRDRARRRSDPRSLSSMSPASSVSGQRWSHLISDCELDDTVNSLSVIREANSTRNPGSARGFTFDSGYSDASRSADQNQADKMSSKTSQSTTKSQPVLKHIAVKQTLNEGSASCAQELVDRGSHSQAEHREHGSSQSRVVSNFTSKSGNVISRLPIATETTTAFEVDQRQGATQRYQCISGAKFEIIFEIYGYN